MKMFGECHAHIFLNGYDYRKAVETQKNGPRDTLIRAHFEEYRKRGIRFVRDGGDHYGVSKRAARLAPEYEIDYRTPVFAIYKEGHYGKIVGKSFSDMKEYHRRVLEAAAEGADFIKIMTTGLLDFADHGKITGTPLSATDVKEMVHIAHEEGFAVMSHTNGCYGVQAAVEAGVDSIEHGNYMDDETISMLADSEGLQLRTRSSRYVVRSDEALLRRILQIASAPESNDLIVDFFAGTGNHRFRCFCHAQTHFIFSSHHFTAQRVRVDVGNFYIDE